MPIKLRKIILGLCLLMPSLPALAAGNYFVDAVILNTTTVSQGCPLTIDALLRNCKSGVPDAYVMVTISRSCGFRMSSSFGPGWNSADFQDIIMSQGNFGNRIRSGTEYHSGACNQYLANCLYPGIPDTGCASYRMSTVNRCGGGPYGLLSYTIPTSYPPGTYYVNVAVGSHNDPRVACWEAMQRGEDTECVAFTVTAAGGCSPPTRTRTPVPPPTLTRTPPPVPTFTRTPPPVPTLTSTPPPVPTFTRTPPPVPSLTSTPPPPPTPPPTVTPLPSRTPSQPPTITVTRTITITVTPPPTNTSVPSTGTRTALPTVFPSASATVLMWTPTATTSRTALAPVWSPSPTPTYTASPTVTFTRTVTPTRTDTPTQTDTRTITVTRTDTPTQTDTRTATVTRTETPTHTDTPTVTDTRTVTATRTDTPTYTATRTQTDTRTITVTRTDTPTRTDTRTVTATRTETPTHTDTPTVTDTRTVTVTRTDTPTYTATRTQTDTRTVTVTRTDTPTHTDTPTVTDTRTITATRTDTPTYTATRTRTDTRTVTATRTGTPTHTGTPPSTLTATPSRTPSATRTPTPTQSSTRTRTLTVTLSFTATQSFSFTPTRSITLSSTPTPIPEPFQVTLKLYNSAGEQVKHFYVGTSQLAPTALTLSMGALADRSIPVQVTIEGLASANAPPPLLWEGDNDNGQPISNGMYYFKMESTDPFGHVTAYEQSVHVMGNLGGNSLAFYNTAGELVHEMELAALPSDLTDFSVQGGQAVLVGGGDPGSGSPLKLSLLDERGQWHAYEWDGLNDLGAPVQAGTYIMKLVRNEVGSRTVIKTASVTVLKPAMHPAMESAASAVLGPNPMGPHDRELVLVFKPSAAGTAGAGVYNVAGELIAQAWVPGSEGRVVVKLENLASGVYAVDFKIRSGNAILGRKGLKFVINK